MITDIHGDSLSFTTFIVFFIATEQPHNSQLISMETLEVAELVLVGLLDDLEVQALRFLTFSLVCLLTRVGNLGWPR